MFHHLSIPYIGKTDLSVKKPSAKTLKDSLEQLTKSQLEWICKSYTEEKFEKKEELVKYHTIEQIFVANMSEEKRNNLYTGWKKAVEATRIFKL